MTTMTAPRRGTRTYQRDSREVYADTGRPVDERLGSHAVLWIVDDPQAWAAAIEADADAEPGRWPRSRRHIGEARKQQGHESAAQVRAEGPRRDVHAVYHNPEQARASVADLRRSHPNPGVRYEVAEITGAGACDTCQTPTIYVDGRWRHHTGRYPADCPKLAEVEVAAGPEQERVDGEFEITVPSGPLVCGYCDETETWARHEAAAQLLVGYLALTGYHSLGVGPDGELVVLAEAEWLGGRIDHLPHLCEKIPDEVRAKYADDIAAVVARRAGAR